MARKVAAPKFNVAVMAMTIPASIRLMDLRVEEKGTLGRGERAEVGARRKATRSGKQAITPNRT